MPNDVDRFLAELGPEPAVFHELRDAALHVPELPPEEAEQMEREFLAGLDDLQRAREPNPPPKPKRRTMNAPALVSSFAGAALVVAVLWVGLKPRPEELDTARGPTPKSSAVVRAGHGPLRATVTPTETAAPERDAGPDGAP